MENFDWPSAALVPTVSSLMVILLRALRFYRAEGPRIVLIYLLMSLSIFAGLIRPWPLALLVDFLLTRHPLPAVLSRWVDPSNASGVVLLVASLTLGLHLLQAGFSTLQNYFSIGVSLRGLARVRTELFSRLQRLSWSFHQRMPIGDLLYRASWDAFAVQTLFQQGLVVFSTALMSLLLMIGVMSQLDARLTWVALLIAPILMGVIRGLGPKMGRRGQEAQQADSEVASRVQQGIQALALIQSYTRESIEAREFSDRVEQARSTRLSQHGTELVYGLAVAIVFALGIGLTVWLGGNRVLEGQLTVGQLLVFLAYLAQIYEPLNQLSHVGATVATAAAGARRVFEILDEPEEGPDPATPAEFPHLSGLISAAPKWRLEFDHVSFAYRSGLPVLRDVSFAIEAGDIVAIVGPSGAGKSTLLHLLPRFFDPTEGRILLSGFDLRMFRRHELRESIGVVFQEPLLLPGTVAENIGFGRSGATRAEIESAARAANAHEFIERLPKGYDTVVGEGAARLSVGEKQRVNLARAFLKDAPILLLDEPTSALDAESERMVVTTLEHLMRGRTTIMVAHRLSTIRAATRVLVLDQGQLVEFGTPEELLKQGGYFSKANAG